MQLEILDADAHVSNSSVSGPCRSADYDAILVKVFNGYMLSTKSWDYSAECCHLCDGRVIHRADRCDAGPAPGCLIESRKTEEYAAEVDESEQHHKEHQANDRELNRCRALLFSSAYYSCQHHNALIVTVALILNSNDVSEP